MKRDFKSNKPFSKCVTDITEVKAKMASYMCRKYLIVTT